MQLKEGIFAVKLCELEREYGLLQSTISICQEKSPDQICRKLEEIKDDLQMQNRLLELSVQNSRLPSVSALAKAQLEYGRKAEKLFHGAMSRDLKGSGQTRSAEQAEAAALYSEYAIDFATQSMRYALACALSALQLQQEADDELTKSPQQKEESYI